MTLKHLLCLAAFVLGPVFSAQAQLGIYGTISGEHIGNVKCLATSGTCPGGNSEDVLGGGGGIFYDFKTFGPARIGVDLRGNILKGNKSATVNVAGSNAVRMDEALGGVRASFHTPIHLLNPYGEAAVGWARHVNPQGFGSGSFDTSIPGSNSSLAWRIYGGIDVPIASIFDVRIPEYGVGQNIGRNGAGSNWVQQVSVGVVFHMPR